MWVRIPLETYIFILNFSLPPRSEQVYGAIANEIKHVHSPEVIVVLDPRYDLSYKALYISTCSIALTQTIGNFDKTNADEVAPTKKNWDCGKYDGGFQGAVASLLIWFIIQGLVYKYLQYSFNKANPWRYIPYLFHSLRSAWRSQQTFLFLFCFFFFFIIKVCLTQSADLSVFVLFFLFFKVCLTQSADLSVFVLFFLFFYYSFLFFSTATCVLRFLHYFSTNLDEIWHVDSPWWDEQTEYFFKSIWPGVGIRRSPIVLLCFIIGKTLYTVRRDKNFT